MGVAYCTRRKMGVAFLMAASYRLDLTYISDSESPKEKRERQSF